MYLAYLQVKQVIPALNERQLTTQDFWAEVGRQGLHVHTLPLAVSGYYLPLMTKRNGKVEHHIHLSDKLTGNDWLETAFHELFHQILHHPGGLRRAQFHASREPIIDQQWAKREAEANALAAVAIVPQWMLFPQNEQALDECEFCHELLRRRRRVYQLYRF